VGWTRRYPQAASAFILTYVRSTLHVNTATVNQRSGLLPIASRDGGTSMPPRVYVAYLVLLM
jgi:hypothetical protein